MKLSFIANYKDNQLNGYYYRTDNHTFTEKGFYKKNKKHGEWEFNKNGETKICTYKNGVKHGFFKTEDETGKTSEGYYKNGKKDGKYKEVSETMIRKGQFRNDKKSGIWTIEDSVTAKTTIEFYKKGNLMPQKK